MENAKYFNRNASNTKRNLSISTFKKNICKFTKNAINYDKSIQPNVTLISIIINGRNAQLILLQITIARIKITFEIK